MKTFCTTCDAADGECEHSGPRYLDEIIYERIEEKAGITWGIRDEDRADWELRLGMEAVITKADRSRPLELLLEELKRWFFVSSGLRRRLRIAHERDASQTTLMIEHAVAGVSAGSLKRPDAWLEAQLREEGIT